MSAGKSVVALRRGEEVEVPLSKCFGFVQTFDSKPRLAVVELMKSRGLEENQKQPQTADYG